MADQTYGSASVKEQIKSRGHEAEPLIAVRGASKSFGATRALVDAELTLRAGEIHGVIGENGSGKSTLLRIVAGLHSADDGSFEIGGTQVAVGDVQRKFRDAVALVSQELSLANDLTVGENILLKSRKPGHSLWIDWRKLHQEAAEVLESLGVDIDTHRRVSSLPLGSRQLVEIARVIAQHSPVMILDEPTSALSDEEVEPLFRVLRQLADQGSSIVIVTHRMDELVSVSDRLTVLRDGRTVGSAHRQAIDRTEIIRLMLGHDADVYTPPTRSSDAERVVLSISGIPGAASDRATRTLELREGEVLGLFGLAGSGCSSLLHRITGTVDAGGRPGMTLVGKPYRPRSPLDALRLGVGYVPADRAVSGLIPMMSIIDNIHVGAPRERFRLKHVNRKRESKQTDQFVASLRVRRASNRTAVSNLSGGNQQKVLVAKALSARPQLLALEEPTRGVDIGAKDEIHRILHQLRDEGMSLVVVSTDIEEMLLLCDRFYVLREGAVVGELSREEATQARLTHLATIETTSQAKAES